MNLGPIKQRHIGRVKQFVPRRKFLH